MDCSILNQSTSLNNLGRNVTKNIDCSFCCNQHHNFVHFLSDTVNRRNIRKGRLVIFKFSYNESEYIIFFLNLPVESKTVQNRDETF